MSRGWRSALLIATTLAAYMACGAEIVSAAQPRPTVRITTGSVKLSDLFSGLEPGQDCMLGAAPVPGTRLIVEQPQLVAIAEQFGVDWQPGVITSQVVLERGARSITQADLLPQLRSALIQAGSPESSEVGLAGFATLLIPAEIVGPPEVESLDYDRTSGRFVAQMLFESPGIDSVRLRIVGTVQELVEAPVLVHAMDAGSVLEAEDLEVRRLPRSRIRTGPLSTIQDEAGLALRRRMAAGTPVLADDLSRPLLVSRGMPVLLRLQSTGMVLTAKGEAIEGGALDERIHVLNPESRAVLVARVTGPGQVQVDPASTPVLLSAQQSGLPRGYSLTAMTQPSNEQEHVR